MVGLVVGDGSAGSADGPGHLARLDSPKHLCVDPRDNVFIADDQNARIRKFDPRTKLVTTVLGAGQGTPSVRLKNPHGVCVEGERLYVVDTGNNRVLSLPLP